MRNGIIKMKPTEIERINNLHKEENYKVYHHSYCYPLSCKFISLQGPHLGAGYFLEAKFHQLANFLDIF